MKKNIIHLFISIGLIFLMSSCANAYGRLMAENQEKADNFLESNKNKADIVTLKSGVQYKILKSGDGKSPTKSSTVMIHYRGSLINGNIFDSSYAKLGPQKFKVLETIEGWQEVLPLMKENSIWRVYIPPELAYGKKGFQDRIGPFELLIFDIELVEVL